MHPAYSVIVFTTAAGGGYGLLVWLAAAARLELVPRDPLFGFVAIGLGLVLVTVGLLSSTFHLGRPERAWRSFSQWRTSWLSREGVAALVTYLPAGALGWAWVFGELISGQFTVSAILVVPCALVTIWCGAMIYASLPTIRAWHQPLVGPIYLVLGLGTGGVLYGLIAAAFGIEARWAAVVTLLVLAFAAVMKSRYWTAIDTEPRTITAEAATGLGALGTVRPLDPPHTQPNFVMREMGYQVGRRHGARLRRLVMALLFAVPIVAMLVLLLDLSAPLRIAIAALAAISAGIGVLTERWLFFAQAEHVVVVYYRGGSA
jgi:DMSO reductase anchor subunit